MSLGQLHTNLIRTSEVNYLWILRRGLMGSELTTPGLESIVIQSKSYVEEEISRERQFVGHYIEFYSLQFKLNHNPVYCFHSSSAASVRSISSPSCDFPQFPPRPPHRGSPCRRCRRSLQEEGNQLYIGEHCCVIKNYRHQLHTVVLVW